MTFTVTKLQVTPTCSDVENSEDCSSWKSYGYCNKSSIYYSFMKAQCSKTCGFCQGKGLVVYFFIHVLSGAYELLTLPLTEHGIYANHGLPVNCAWVTCLQWLQEVSISQDDRDEGYNSFLSSMTFRVYRQKSTV